MALEQFHIIERICRIGLAHAGTLEFRKQIAYLRNILARESRDGQVDARRTAAREQAACLTVLLDRFGPAAPIYPGHGDPPTPQTAARLKSDSILALVRSGRLDHEHLLAAEQIREVYSVLVSNLAAKTSSPDQVRMSLKNMGPWRQPFELMPERLVRLYHDHYKPWAAEIGRRKYGTKTLLELTIDVVVEAYSLHDIERSQKLRNGSASKPLRDSLQRYAELAGWLRPEHRNRRVPASSIFTDPPEVGAKL